MNEIAPIFKDPELQYQFERDGYVKIKLLDRAKAKKLYNYYIDRQKDHDIIDGLYHSTTHTNNPDLILAVDDQIKSVLLSESDAFFQHYMPMMCTYITKQPGRGSETKLHQDPTFVDESKYVSANIWVALHDIDHDNGNLFFVKGTNRLIASLRVTPGCPTAYDGVKDLLEENLTEVPVYAGEAIVINHATIHGATPNLTAQPRVAAVMAIRSAASDWIYHYIQPDAPFDKIEKYSLDLHAFAHLKKDGQPEKENFLGYIQWHFPQISRRDFMAGIQDKVKQPASPSWRNKLAGIKELFAGII
jgi:ectoine hydroxylase-related dioxygenase (phytanoyl-CoA dioxygenase family)